MRLSETPLYRRAISSARQRADIAPHFVRVFSRIRKCEETRGLAGGPRWIQTRGPVYAPHVPGNTGEFAREKSPRENCRLSLYAFALHRPLRDLKSGLGIEAEMMRKAPLRS
jgi:hypothetical protein